MSNENIVWHQHQVDKSARGQQNKQRPCVLWFTGLSGSGKSTVAGAFESALFAQGHRTYLLDGDNVRHGLCKENIRRVGEVAKLMVDAGLVVVTAFISPHRVERQAVRELFPDGEFIEVFIDTPLEVCESRDPKGLYKKARAGEIKHFTGIDSPYEAPLHAELTIANHGISAEEAALQIINYLEQHGYLQSA